MTAVVVLAEPAGCPLCGGRRAVTADALNGQPPVQIACPLCASPASVHDYLFRKVLHS